MSLFIQCRLCLCLRMHHPTLRIGTFCVILIFDEFVDKYNLIQLGWMILYVYDIIMFNLYVVSDGPSEQNGFSV